MSYERSVTLHQQDGGLSIQAFAEREGLTPGQVKRCIKRGKVVGARKDARTKKWFVYPPAKLLERPRSHSKRISPGADGFDFDGVPHAPDEAPALRVTVHPTEARAGARLAALGQMGIPEGGGCTPATAGEAVGTRPSAGRFSASVAALPGATRSLRAWQPASCGKPDVYTEARSICRALHDAALKQYREGIHYLRLNAQEFAQLYAALSNDRSRVRKMVGKGLLPVGLLRASDSTWQKLQAMSREGKLL